MNFSLLRPALAALLMLAAMPLQAREPAEHDELEASLAVPYRADSADGREVAIELLFPGRSAVAVAWRLQIVDAQGRLLREWTDSAVAGDRRSRLALRWDDTDAAGLPLPAGIYTARLAALDGTPQQLQQGLAAAEVESALANPVRLPQLQQWDFVVGPLPLATMPAFEPLPLAGATSWLRNASDGPPYAIHYGNLHSQTNHSDGGGDLSTCNNAETPQAGAFGPTAAFAYADAHGLDFLMASEHNHMYDGRANGVSASATPQFANNLYADGLAQAAAYSAAHADFFALYGMEWGVTTDGGHLNVIGAEGLYNWEYNGANQLIGSFYTPKSDYAALYTFMRGQQVLGQFNHPDTSGQFLVAGTALGYSSDGDEVMVLTEVLNSSAFSVNTTETETSRSSFEGAWKRLLERGFHTAPASNQDNHCANWGAAYSNRTGVLIPADQPLTAQSFRAALLARRVFATMDKTAQMLFSSGERIMGMRFANSGALALRVDYASSSGHLPSQVQIYEGVPGRNGTVTLAASTATPTLNPTPGEHFYYAKITQDDGKSLWSAPLWVTQLDPADTIFRGGFF